MLILVAQTLLWHQPLPHLLPLAPCQEPDRLLLAIKSTETATP